MAAIETDGPAIRRFMIGRCGLRSAGAGRARAMRTMCRSALLRRSTRSRRMGHDVLSGLFRIRPIGTIENGHIRLQNGKVVSIENEKAKTEQFERSFPGTARPARTSRRHQSTRGRKLRPFCRRLAPGGMPFEQWINCRLGFDISIPNSWRDKTTVARQAANAAIRTTTPICNVQCEQVRDTARRLSPA